MPRRRGFARRHRSSSSSSSSLSLSPSLLPTHFYLLQLLLEPRIARYPLYAFTRVLRICTCMRRVQRAHLLTYREDSYVYVRARMHERTHACSCGSSLILLEATDAPISARVSFVIRENVNQSLGPRRLQLLRTSRSSPLPSQVPLSLYPLAIRRSRMCAYVHALTPTTFRGNRKTCPRVRS